MNLDNILNPIKSRILNMIGRCLLEAATVSEDGVTLKVKLGDDETQEGLEYLQHYGLASVPKKGAQGLSVFVGGDRSHGIVIATEDARYRLKEMEEGEVALYTDEGDAIHLKRGRIIDIKTETLKVSASKKVEFDTPEVVSTGEVKDSIGTLSSLRNSYNGHTHIGNLGSPTSPPTPTDPAE